MSTTTPTPVTFVPKSFTAPPKPIESSYKQERLRIRRESKTDPSKRECSFCHELGHIIDACPKILCRQCRTMGHTDRVCEAEPCGTCSRFGHTSDNCFRNAICETCGYQGHIAERCQTPQCGECGKFGHGEATCFRLAQCALCLRTGHPATHCREEPHCETCREDHYPGDCRYHKCGTCGESGHLTKWCSNPYIVRTRRSWGR